ncbi:hypothetical protein LUW75_01120 [Streptomyces sp. MRC013]|uniref:hypothetical protein n=1 Tax=Streptomyces sp. MRC013 TaxID=2898276 RepID=UPI002026E7D0|nr:hypothetical protein [Streptomyces sp. MRC013]URM88847.1 hypothetical protein LUW75_01120 [Streptomyces sp. MRC013]
MRSPKPAGTAPSAVLALLVLPLVALALAVVQTSALAAAVRARAAAPHPAAQSPLVHAPAAGRQTSVGAKECEQSGPAVNGAPRGRDRHRAGTRAPLPPTAAHPSRTADPPGGLPRAGPLVRSGREGPRAAPTLADLQVFRC